MFLFGNLKGNGKLWKRSYFNFTRIGTWGRMFHALKKINDHSKRKPINRNNSSSNYERQKAVVSSISI